MSYVDFGLPPREVENIAAYWRSAATNLKPKAVLVVSAHWEASVPTVMTSPRPPLLYDYYGFPPAAYEITWPAPGAPALAARVRELLEAAQFESQEDKTRGFDHGTFVPLGRMFPKADVPTVQLSLMADLDPARHLAMGRALAPMREEGVLILGSGMSYHNMKGFRSAAATAVAEAFDSWIASSVAKQGPERDAALTAWVKAPRAREAHPREEHLLPLMVAAGAAAGDEAQIAWRGTVGGKRVSAVHFG